MIISYLDVISKISSQAKINPRDARKLIKLGEWTTNDKRSKAIIDNERST